MDELNRSTAAPPHPGPLPGEGERRAGGLPVTLCFAGATFLGAFLLFLVQPLVAKYILPWFGGGATVWTTCMLFFQATLLGGYLYAHLGVSRLRVRGQAGLHVAVLVAAAVAALPAVTPSAAWQPHVDAGGANPTWRILLLLAATVGLPCLALSATSPLLHAWYSRIRPGAAVYRLYALSNVGSLLALLAYPFVVEPLLSRRAQATAWSVALAVFAVLCAACALLATRHAGEARPANADADGPIPTAAPAAGTGWTRGLLWLALPACATALLLAATNTITQDLAPVPLLWILPLALYLLTFIIAFDRPAWYHRTAWGLLLVAATGGAIWLLFKADDVETAAVIVVSVAAVMFVGCMVLHGELARLRPPPQRLTAYYLTIAAGGVLGGLLVAVGAPVLLRSYAELPAALWACCLLAFLAPLLAERRMPRGIPGMLGVTGIVCLAPLAWHVAYRMLPEAKLIDRSRDYYGVLSVWERAESDGGQGVVLHHGSITHGHQHRAETLRETPTTYYHPGTAVGTILGEDSPLPTPRRVGVVGLGTGTIAAYAQAGDAYRFYDISPNVLRIAETHFTYLADARARGAIVTVALGDARLSLEREADPQQLDALVLDAFSGDAIPVHLLTAEAFDLYRRHLAPSGVLCVHVSNKYLDLDVVVAAAAKRLGWAAVLVSTDDGSGMDYSADWVLLGPDPYRIEQLRRLGGEPLPDAPRDFPLWTDERTNVLRILH